MAYIIIKKEKSIKYEKMAINEHKFNNFAYITAHSRINNI